MDELWVFDCDGVLLDSNCIKLDALKRTFDPYGSTARDELVRLHSANPGLSRFDLVCDFFTTVLGRPAQDGEGEGLLTNFGRACREGLASATVDPAATHLLGLLHGRGVLTAVASGGEESEVRWALKHHSLSHYFDSISGSPRAKPLILASLLAHHLPSRSVMVGDSWSDVTAARSCGMTTVVVTHWSSLPESSWSTLDPAPDHLHTDLAAVAEWVSGVSG